MKTNSILIMGDFNLPDINWSTLTSSAVHSDCFCEFVFDCNRTQLVDGSTHCKGNCLDLILSNTPDSVGSISISPHSLIQSDQYLLSFTLPVRNHSSIKPKQFARYVPDLSKLNYINMAEYLLDVDFSDCLLSTDANFIWCRLRSCILEAIDLLASKVKLKPKKHSPCWFNSSIRHQINRVRTARKKTNAKPTVVNKLKLEDAECCLCDMMSAAKSSYESQLVNEFAFSNNNKIYKYINSIMKSENIPDIMHLNGQSASTDTNKATLFNTFFKSVYFKASESSIPISSHSTSQPSLEFINITDLEVYTALSKLDPTKACGIVGIGPKLLQSCALALYPVIHHLFSISLWYCDIPSEWKLHCIIPIFKSGDRSSISNYRPISLLCSISKDLERLVYDKVFEFVGQSISCSQFSFLRKHSCLQQLLLFLKYVVDSFTNKHQLDTIYMDFRKAFDKVPHPELLHKLRNIGISGTLLKWFSNYLMNRKQLVSINGNHSTILPVSSGVPQGSILGPLLFLVYINDLPQYADNCKVFLFADDTKCCHQIQSFSDISDLQASINRLSDWSMKWRLHFNDSKCVVMIFHSSSSSIFDYDYKIGSNFITSKDTHRDLGIMLQTNLNWSNHYDHICCKAYRVLSLLRRSFSSTNSISTKKKLYISLVRSQLTYCSQMWKPALIKDIKKLEKLQRRATKFILGYHLSGLDYKDRLIQLKLLPLMYFFELADIMFLVNSLKNPSDRFNILEYVQMQDLNTRSSDKPSLKHISMHRDESISALLLQ